MAIESNFEKTLSTLLELLTAKHDHGGWKPSVTLAYLGDGEWYLSMSEFLASPDYRTSTKRALLRGKFASLREAIREAAETLAEAKVDALKSRLLRAAEKL